VVALGRVERGVIGVRLAKQDAHVRLVGGFAGDGQRLVHWNPAVGARIILRRRAGEKGEGGHPGIA
jgi:hypothetical protein